MCGSAEAFNGDSGIGFWDVSYIYGMFGSAEAFIDNSSIGSLVLSYIKETTRKRCKKSDQNETNANLRRCFLPQYRWIDVSLPNII
jgi:hypothetical protein